MAEQIYTDMNGMRYVANTVATIATTTLEYERGFVDGMQKQMQSNVHKAVNRLTRPWVDLTGGEINHIWAAHHDAPEALMLAVQAKLKEKNA